MTMPLVKAYALVRDEDGVRVAILSTRERAEDIAAVWNNGSLTYHVQEIEAPLQVLSLAGSCRNGAQRDQGTLWHAVAPGDHKALCGREPGRRSAGWSAREGATVTCERCLKKLAQLAPPAAGILTNEHRSS